MSRRKPLFDSGKDRWYIFVAAVLAVGGMFEVATSHWAQAVLYLGSATWLALITFYAARRAARETESVESPAP